jgi:formylglycine-generating enzyme required for sulfatase activity
MKYHAIRGGSWTHFAQSARSANRGGSDPGNRYSYVGFRLVRTDRLYLITLLHFVSSFLKRRDMKKKKYSLGKFVKIKSGKFLMGSPESEVGRFSDEKQHEVKIKKDFDICTTQVTQEQWESVMGSNPSHFKGDRLPVENVSYYDVLEFIKELNDSQDSYTYRLPTEEEWEYACRAGSQTAYSFGDDPKKLDQYAVYNTDKTAPVGSKKPNPWGLYDMHGNVWEWTSSVYQSGE